MPISQTHPQPCPTSVEAPAAALIDEPSQSPPTAAFSHGLRVYWEDTDAGGIVYYANYLKFFERARTEWLRSLGVDQQRLRQQTGAQFVVADLHIKYRAPAQLDDELRITVSLRERGAASMLLAQQAWRASSLLIEGSVRVACVDAVSLRPRRFPSEVLNCIP